MSSPPVFSGVRVTRSLVLYVMFCRSLFVLLSFFFWPLCCLFFDLRILITPLVSSSSSCINFSTTPYFVIHCFNVCNLVLYYSNVLLSQDLTLSFLSSKDRVMLSEHKRTTCNSYYRYKGKINTIVIHVDCQKYLLQANDVNLIYRDLFPLLLPVYLSF